MKRFLSRSDVSFTQTLALPVALSHHPAPAKEHPEVVLLPVGLNLRFNIVGDLQKHATGSVSASGCEGL